MIDPASGEILLPSDDLKIGPGLTREQFLASPLAGKSRPFAQGEMYCSFELPRVELAGHVYAWSLSFRGPVLRGVTIACADGAFGSSWEDWSEESEQARKRLHNEQLAVAFGERQRQYRFSWGTVESLYDPRSGGSTIEVVYRAAPRGWRDLLRTYAGRLLGR